MCYAEVSIIERMFLCPGRKDKVKAKKDNW